MNLDRDTENEKIEMLENSVRNQSDIIARYGLSNAKPSLVDFILQLPEVNLR